MPVTKEWIWNNDTGNDWGTRRRTCPRISWSTTNRTCNDLESNPCLRNIMWVTWFSKHVSKGNCCGLLVVAFKKANCLSLRGADRPKISCIATGKLPQLLKSTGVPGNVLVITPVWQYLLFGTFQYYISGIFLQELEPPFLPRTTRVQRKKRKWPPKGRGWHKPPNALVFLGRLAPRN
jgi:hypothetical protein